MGFTFLAHPVHFACYRQANYTHYDLNDIRYSLYDINETACCKNLFLDYFLHSINQYNFADCNCSVHFPVSDPYGQSPKSWCPTVVYSEKLKERYHGRKAEQRKCKYMLNFYRVTLCVARSQLSQFCPSVRLSVCPSICHTRALCPHGSTYTIVISSPYGSPIILVSGISRPSKNSKGVPRGRALNEGWVGTNWRFSTNKPPYLRNGARYDKGYY